MLTGWFRCMSKLGITAVDPFFHLPFKSSPSPSLHPMHNIWVFTLFQLLPVFPEQVPSFHCHISWSTDASYWAPLGIDVLLTTSIHTHKIQHWSSRRVLLYLQSRDQIGTCNCLSNSPQFLPSWIFIPLLPTHPTRTQANISFFVKPSLSILWPWYKDPYSWLH